MDTWATSSLTPQVAGQAGEDEELYRKVFPFDVRPQAHDIIRTWLFTTVLRSQLDEDALLARLVEQPPGARLQGLPVVGRVRLRRAEPPARAAREQDARQCSTRHGSL